MNPKKRADMGYRTWDMGAILRALFPCPMSHVLCPQLLMLIALELCTS